MLAVAAASSIVSGSPLRVDGTNDSTHKSVSESRNTSLMNASPFRHDRYASPGCARVAQLLFCAVERNGWAPSGSDCVHAPVGFTK